MFLICVNLQPNISSLNKGNSLIVKILSIVIFLLNLIFYSKMYGDKKYTLFSRRILLELLLSGRINDTNREKESLTIQYTTNIFSTSNKSVISIDLSIYTFLFNLVLKPLAVFLILMSFPTIAIISILRYSNACSAHSIWLACASRKL